jgi:hypothetical protein
MAFTFLMLNGVGRVSVLALLIPKRALEQRETRNSLARRDLRQAADGP